MNWFEEQLQNRQKKDNDLLQEAYRANIDAIIGESFSFDLAQDAVNIILKYYGLAPVKDLDDIKSEAEKLNRACRMRGLMRRQVTLDGDWYRSAFGAFLGQLKKSGRYVALIPNKFGRYEYYDADQQKHIRINKKTAQDLCPSALCFYEPLPAKPLTISDLLHFGLSALNISDYIYVLILLGVVTLVGLLVPKLNYFLYGYVIEKKSTLLLVSTLIFVISVRMSTIFLNSIKSMFSARTTIKINAALQSATMMRVLSMPSKFFRQFSTGEITERLNCMSTFSNSAGSLIFSSLLSSLFSLAYITQIFSFTPVLVVPSLVTILASVSFSLYSIVKQSKLSKYNMDLKASHSEMEIDMVQDIAKLKLAGAEQRIFARYALQVAEEHHLQYNPPAINKYSSTISRAISLTGLLVLDYITIKSGINTAQYFAFSTAYGMVSAAITSLADIAISGIALRPSLEMLEPMLKTVPENEIGAKVVNDLKGGIEFNSVSFRYEESLPDVVHDFSLKIEPGQYVAVVGQSGCGKSTLIRLLLGFEVPQTGAIYFDGQDLKQLEKRSIRQHIGTVMQNDKLMVGTIYSNIVICDPSLSIDAAWEAAETAGIAEDIKAMPDGMFTKISEGSGGISGGQVQRLAIARAIAPKPKILIFDEATSALDNVTQKKITEALDGQDCTRIVIAHRLSTIRHCDRILVMDQGKIIEDGTYEELEKKGGFFASLVERQKIDA